MSRDHTPDNITSFVDNISYSLNTLHYLTQRQRMFDSEAEIMERKLRQLEDDIARLVKSHSFYENTYEWSFLSRLKENQAWLEEKNTHPEHEPHSHLSHPWYLSSVMINLSFTVYKSLNLYHYVLS